MRKVLILGATGSIGTTALNAVRDGKLDVKITGLAARHNEDRLKALAEEFDCPYIINDDSNKLDAFIASSDSDIALNGIASDGVQRFHWKFRQRRRLGRSAFSARTFPLSQRSKRFVLE